MCKGVKLPDDVILVDLDTNEVTIPEMLQSLIPELPEPECSNLKENFMRAMGKTVSSADITTNRSSGSFETSYKMDPDEIDVAVRIAMVRILMLLGGKISFTKIENGVVISLRRFFHGAQ